MSSTNVLTSFDRIGAYVSLGIIIIILGVGFGITIKSELILYLSFTIQYERAVILRLGKYQRQAGPGIQTRIPFKDNVLVVDIRERVREFKAEINVERKICRAGYNKINVWKYARYHSPLSTPSPRRYSLLIFCGNS